MGAFPHLSRNVPFCLHLSSFVLRGARNEDKSGQTRTNGDNTGHFGTNGEAPPFSILPHLALLENSFFCLRTHSRGSPGHLSFGHRLPRISCKSIQSWKMGIVCESEPLLQGLKGENQNLQARKMQISTVCILGALQRHVDLQGVFVKIGDVVKFKGSLVEFLENRRSCENQKIDRKVAFSEPRLLQCT